MLYGFLRQSGNRLFHDTQLHELLVGHHQHLFHALAADMSAQGASTVIARESQVGGAGRKVDHEAREVDEELVLDRA